MARPKVQDSPDAVLPSGTYQRVPERVPTSQPGFFRNTGRMVTLDQEGHAVDPVTFTRVEAVAPVVEPVVEPVVAAVEPVVPDLPALPVVPEPTPEPAPEPASQPVVKFKKPMGKKVSK
jgi:hypothetical protein